MPSRPTVSVLLPAFRAEACIARAVGSVMAQDFDDWEIVIASDDGADYLMVLAGAGLADARIRQVDTGGNGSGTPLFAHSDSGKPSTLPSASWNGADQ